MGWSLAIWASLVGGIVMAMWAMMMHKFGASRLSMSMYEGCMITKSDSGAGTFAAGMMMHLVISVVVAFVYAWLFEGVFGQATWGWGALIGAGHWLLGGLVLPLMDKMNACVERGAIPALKFFASGYGGGAVFTFLVGHLIYGAVVGWIYEVLGT